ncbi:MAG: histidine kinase [Solirubrobacterales bacterium]|jgi:signal transduction histidine kinase|nr:histidine kinase [Solirubrobacterales bacterium]
MLTLLPTLGLVVALVLLARERRAASARAELVTRACHEVRGPLTAAHLALHGLGRRGVPVAAVEDELWRAARALADLAVAPAGERALDAPEAVDVGALLRRQTTSWRAAAEARGCELHLREPAVAALVRADRLRLAQATANLVGNALEHGGGRIEVRVARVGDRVCVEVTDEGPGLPAGLRELTRRAHGGRGSRGRGLAIAAEIAERHGGCVATAPVSQGARLVLELPACRHPVAEAPAG